MKSRPIIPNAAILNTTKQLEKFQNEMSSQIKNVNDNQKTTGLYIMYNQYRASLNNSIKERAPVNSPVMAKKKRGTSSLNLN